MVAYWTWSLEDMVQDVRDAPLPLNEAGVDFWKERLLVRYVTTAQGTIRHHTTLTFFLAVGFLIQFTKAIRSKSIAVHIWVGRFILLSVLLSIPNFLDLIKGLPSIGTKYI